MNLRWTAFPLHPETPEAGRSLEELFAGRQIDLPDMLDQLGRVAAELNLPFGHRTQTYNSRRAQELGKLAEARGVGNRYHNAVFRAYFAEGRNIARIPILLEIAAEAGLMVDEAREALQGGLFRKAVDRDWERAWRQRVTAVPTFVHQNERLVGAQPYPALVALVQKSFS